jgi:activator of HSP90 ATPase
MNSILISRRALAYRMAAIPLGVGMASRLGAAQIAAAASQATAQGLSHSAASIRQEVLFRATRRRVYEALTNSQQFDAVTRLSDGLALVTAAGAKPTSISPELGGAFTLFGGYITGRNLEMQPDERLVQAWRAGSWQTGDYSIVKFALSDEGADTKVTFDHGGFPESQGASLARWWHVHYWTPLAKYLSA